MQGVGYRAFALGAASRRGLRGTVRNLEDGRVELEVEGMKETILGLTEDLKIGPPASRVTAVDIDWHPATGRFSGFHIRY